VIADSLRPFFSDVIVTSSGVFDPIPGLTYTLPDNATTEVSVLVVARIVFGADAKTFYRHASYVRDGGGAPVSLTYTTPVDNDAGTAGAAAVWEVQLVTVGNDVQVQVKDPGGNAVKWTGEIQLTIGNQ